MFIWKGFSCDPYRCRSRPAVQNGLCPDTRCSGPPSCWAPAWSGEECCDGSCPSHVWCTLQDQTDALKNGLIPIYITYANSPKQAENVLSWEHFSTRGWNQLWEHCTVQAVISSLGTSMQGFRSSRIPHGIQQEYGHKYERIYEISSVSWWICVQELRISRISPWCPEWKSAAIKPWWPNTTHVYSKYWV